MAEAVQRVRAPIVAGRFYESAPDRLVEHARRLIDAAAPRTGLSRVVGAIAPHAGWVCSGRPAAVALRALAEGSGAATVLMTGSVHTIDLEGPALDEADAWRTPLGNVPVDAELRAALAGLAGFGVLEPAHRYEHALEVELPLMQMLWGEGLRIVPCMIPPSLDAVAWGESIGGLLAAWSEPVALLCSTDLTHYGPNYGFAPHGVGEAGRRWAKERNDRALLDRVEALDAAGALREATDHRSACGGGAIAAVLAAARRMGAARGVVLDHTDSTSELEPLGYHDADNSVGYAAAGVGW